MPLFKDVNTPHLTYDEYAIQNGKSFKKNQTPSK